MRLFLIIIFLSIMLFITACADDRETVHVETLKKLSEDNVFKDYEGALDKAKAVEQTIKDAAKQRDEEINKLGG